MEQINLIRSYSEFERYAKALASRVKTGDVVALCGELGVGKTTLVQIIGRELGITNTINSPTYLIIKEYPFTKNNNFIHIDAYRLGNSRADFENIQEYIIPNNLVFVEWADKIKQIIPENSKWIEIRINKNGDREIIEK